MPVRARSPPTRTLRQVAAVLDTMLLSDQDIRNRLLIARLPAMPQILVKLIEHLQADDLGMPELAALIAKDAGMTAKLLAVANSSAYHRSTRSANLEQSLVALGTDMIKTLVISDSVFQTFNSFPHSGSIDLRALLEKLADGRRDRARCGAHARLRPSRRSLPGRPAAQCRPPGAAGHRAQGIRVQLHRARRRRPVRGRAAHAADHPRRSGRLADRTLAPRFLPGRRGAVPPRAERPPRRQPSPDPHRAPGASADLPRRRRRRSCAGAVRCAASTSTRSAQLLDARRAPGRARPPPTWASTWPAPTTSPQPPAYAPPPAVDPVQQRLTEEVRNLVLVSEVGPDLGAPAGRSRACSKR